MKKIVLVLILFLVLFGFVKLPNVGASTNSVDDLNTIFDTYYNDGYYTKETKIYLNETATNELTTLNCWHNNVSLLERTTYYKGDALWMSNHLGGYSYYGTSGNNMTHAYVSSLEETSDKIVVSGKTMEEYYYTLLDLNIVDCQLVMRWLFPLNVTKCIRNSDLFM